MAARSRRRPSGTLVKALARAWRWQRMLAEGVYMSVSEIGDAEDISKSCESYFLARGAGAGHRRGDTPVPEIGFPGLKPGDRWCFCAARWKEALDAGVAPRVVLRATHENALEYVSFEELKKRALDLA